MPFTKLRQSLIKPYGSITGSLSGTSSYARRAITASYALNASGGGGSTLTTGSTYPITSSYARRAITASYALNTFFQTGSIVNQTILYNVRSGSSNTITGLNLSGNKWSVNVVEEWNSSSIAGDQYYTNVGLLLHLDGTNGSTTFTDNSQNNFTVTQSNGAAISTAQSKFGGASVYFDGSDDYISTAANSAFDISSGDFTVEFWFRPSSVGGGYGFIVGQVDYLVAGWSLWQYADGLRFYRSNSFELQIGGVLTANVWHHIAFVKYGTGANSLKIYVNGSNVISGDYTWTYASNRPLVLGGITTSTGWNNNFYISGYIDELRITKGVARYTGNFTTQSAAFLNNASSTQYVTKYIGTVGGLNDKTVDYGVQKLNDSSLKIVKMSQVTSPFPSGSLSSSIDRVYVNVLDYTKVAVTSSYASRALTASYVNGGITAGRVYALTSLFS